MLESAGLNDIELQYVCLHIFLNSTLVFVVCISFILSDFNFISETSFFKNIKLFFTYMSLG